MKYIYSAISNSFYPLNLKKDYQNAGTWPEDAVEIDEATYIKFTALPPDGKQRAADENGMPAWVDIPPFTHDEIKAQEESEKQNRIYIANSYINNKQWPGKAAIGRLKGSELAQYNLWLDYLDELEAVDTSSSQAIIWPVPPDGLAS